MNLKNIGLGFLDTVVKVIFIIVIAMLIAKYAKVAYNYGYQVFNQTPVSSGAGRTVSFTVGSGDSAAAIADKLSSVGLITDKTLFRIQERFSEYHGMEQPGTYELSTAMTPEEMLAIMSGGRKSGEEEEEADIEQQTYEAPEPELSPAAEEAAGEQEAPAEGEGQEAGEESNGG